MALDRITEMVSHFIGIFETAGDGARMRDLADGFRHATDPKPEFGPQTSVQHLLRAPYSHDGTQDQLSDFQFYTEATPFVPSAPPSGIPDTWLHSVTSFNPLPLSRLKEGFFENEQSLHFAGLPLGSTAVLGHQFNVLVDHDLITGAGTINFIAPEAFDAALTTLTQTAMGMATQLIGNPFDIIDAAEGFGQTLSVDYATLSANAPDEAQVMVVSGDDAFGITMNGVAAETAPDLDDLMPAYLQTELQEDAPEAAPSGIGGNAAAAGEVFDVEDGHAVVAGGNLAINETLLAFSAVDAPIIAVMGDAIATISICQINIIHNADIGANLTPASDVAINAASIALTTSQQVEDDTQGSPDTTTPFEGSPLAWAVTQIGGDLTTLNWIHQYNFLSDHDRAEVTLTGEDSFIGLGGNTALNQTTLQEMSVSYDLIIVGGQMIDMALISQTNVLLDDDIIINGGRWPGTISGGDNLAFNAATIETVGIDNHTGLHSDFDQAGQALANGVGTISADLAHSDYFVGIPFLNVLYISGDLITITSIAQTNIVGDADQVGATLAALEDTADGPLTVTMGSNAVVNIASIMEYGMDSTVMVGGEVYDDVLLYQAELIETDADPLGVAHTPLASEAVAFLAEDMVQDEPVTDSVFAGQIETSTTSVDVMGGVVA